MSEQKNAPVTQVHRDIAEKIIQAWLCQKGTLNIDPKNAAVTQGSDLLWKFGFSSVLCGRG